MNPETLVRILNGYFEAASTAVTHHGGHVAKFIGDGVMAIFGAPESNAWHAMDAVIAAVALRDSIGAYNEDLRNARTFLRWMCESEFIAEMWSRAWSARARISNTRSSAMS